jgi:hypothetical protein
MMNRKNIPGFGNPMRKSMPPLPVVGRTLVGFPNKNMVSPIVSFRKRKIGFA